MNLALEQLLICCLLLSSCDFRKIDPSDVYITLCQRDMFEDQMLHCGPQDRCSQFLLIQWNIQVKSPYSCA